MVPRPTPSALAISATVMSRASYRARARATWAGESLAGRPPTRPQARAAARPTAARSAISSRSNSASAAKMWKTSRPVLVVQPPHHQRVSCPQVPQAQRELRPLGQLPRRCIGKGLLAARRDQRVSLPAQVL